MLTLEKVKNTFFTNTYNKFLATSYFINKKYDDTCIKEYFLLLELSNSFNDEFTIYSNIKSIDMSNLGTIIINNIFNNIVQPSSAGSYKHTQLSNVLVWNVAHNLGYLPSEPLITDTSGVNISGVVNNIDINNSTITFSHVQSGYAYFS